jgi:hypothetical protein
MLSRLQYQSALRSASLTVKATWWPPVIEGIAVIPHLHLRLRCDGIPKGACPEARRQPRARPDEVMDGRSDLERSLRRRIGAISGGLPFRSRSLPVSRAELPCAATGNCDRRHREPMRQLAACVVCPFRQARPTA